MNIVDRAKKIVMTPKTEWPVISSETPVIGEIMLNYVLPLALIPAVAQAIGYGLVGGPLISWSITAAVAAGLVSFLTAVVGVFVTAYVVDFLAPNFGSQKNLGRAVQLVAFSNTPGWLAGILNIIPALGMAGVAGITVWTLSRVPGHASHDEDTPGQSRAVSAGNDPRSGHCVLHPWPHLESDSLRDPWGQRVQRNVRSHLSPLPLSLRSRHERKGEG